MEINDINYKYKALYGSDLHKIDYSFKSEVMNTEVPALLNNLSYHCHFGTCNIKFYDDYMNYLLSTYSIKILKEGMRINNANYKRVARLRDRIKEITRGRSFFLTLTFTDSVFSSTNQKTRRLYVSRYLKSITNNYVGNIDFGSLNGREHYHAVVLCDNIDHNDWPYGAINFELITYNENCNDKIAKYINKLTNHAIKDTTKRYALLYPKKKS